MNLEKLFQSESSSACKGCKILDKSGQHTILDFEGKQEKEILFVSDSLKMYQGDYVPFRGNEYKLIRNELNSLGINIERVGFTASVKCPNLKMDEMSANDRKICRQHLISTIKQFKPKLVFACGKLATTMFYGKNVEDKKSRGKIADFDMEGEKFKLVSIFHPYSVLAEPKNHYLFNVDVRLSIEEVILGIKKKTSFVYLQIHSIDDLNKEGVDFLGSKDPISIDIETEGFNFFSDLIHTCALSLLDPGTLLPYKTISFPVDHKETKCYGPFFRDSIINFLKKVMSNKNNRKILQKAKFDLKFLKREGIEEIYNIWDTKVMQSMYREEYPRSLSDLVQYYYPNEI